MPRRQVGAVETGVGPPWCVLLPARSRSGFASAKAGRDARSRGLLSMRIFLRAIKDLPHPEEPDRAAARAGVSRSEEHTSELQSLMRISYAVFCLKKTIHNHI